MEPRLTLVTLGTKNLATLRAFYSKGLKWVEAPGGNADVAFYDLNGVVLSLFSEKELAKDAAVPAKGAGFRKMALDKNGHIVLPKIKGAKR